MWGNFYLLVNNSFDTRKFKMLTSDPEMWMMSPQNARVSFSRECEGTKVE